MYYSLTVTYSQEGRDVIPPVRRTFRGASSLPSAAFRKILDLLLEEDLGIDTHQVELGFFGLEDGGSFRVDCSCVFEEKEVVVTLQVLRNGRHLYRIHFVPEGSEVRKYEWYCSIDVSPIGSLPDLLREVLTSVETPLEEETTEDGSVLIREI